TVFAKHLNQSLNPFQTLWYRNSLSQRGSKDFWSKSVDEFDLAIDSIDSIHCIESIQSIVKSNSNLATHLKIAQPVPNVMLQNNQSQRIKTCEISCILGYPEDTVSSLGSL